MNKADPTNGEDEGMGVERDEEDEDVSVEVVEEDKDMVGKLGDVSGDKIQAPHLPVGMDGLFRYKAAV